MPLKKGSQHWPQTQREWDEWARQVAVTPDPDSVTTVTVADKAITNAKLRDSQPASVIGRVAPTSGAPSDIVASSDNTFLVRRGGVLSFGSVGDGDIPDTITRDAELAASVATLTTAYIAADTALVAAHFSAGTYTGAFTGTTTDPAPTIRYSVSGSIVVLQLPSTTATSNSVSFTLTGAPAAIRPARSQSMFCRTFDNGVVQLSIATLDTGGVITFGYGVTGAAYTNTGTKGFSAASITYSLD